MLICCSEKQRIIQTAIQAVGQMEERSHPHHSTLPSTLSSTQHHSCYSSATSGHGSLVSEQTTPPPVNSYHAHMYQETVYEVRKQDKQDNLKVEKSGMKPAATIAAANNAKDHPPPLNSSRLRPIRQKTRNAIVNILSDGWICLEFIKQKGGSGKVAEVLKISPNGMDVLVYTPNKTEESDSPPPPPTNLKHIKNFTHQSLPQKYWRKYQYAVRFVNLVRSKTPKVTLYTKLAKCMLMENEPEADFEVNFYDGKYTIFCDLF